MVPHDEVGERTDALLRVHPEEPGLAEELVKYAAASVELGSYAAGSRHPRAKQHISFGCSSCEIGVRLLAEAIRRQNQARR